jgi:RNA polymerase sigma factor for flagellar operon FliA
MHLPLVRAIAARLYRARWNDALAFEEYVQMGALGLLEAAGRFDAGRGVSFGAFASWRIAGSILNGLERATEQHQQLAARRRWAAGRVSSLAADGPPCSDGSLEERLAALVRVAVGLAVGFMLEGSGMYCGGGEATARDGSAELADRQLGRRLRDALRGLPSQERRVLEEHYFEHRPFADIAAALRLTRGRVSQLHKRGIDRLRDRLRTDAPPTAFEA